MTFSYSQRTAQISDFRLLFSRRARSMRELKKPPLAQRRAARVQTTASPPSRSHEQAALERVGRRSLTTPLPTRGHGAAGSPPT